MPEVDQPDAWPETCEQFANMEKWGGGAGYICALAVEKQLSEVLTFTTMPDQAITHPLLFPPWLGVCV